MSIHVVQKIPSLYTTLQSNPIVLGYSIYAIIYSAQRAYHGITLNNMAIQKLWKEIDHLRPDGTDMLTWTRSYEAITAALSVLNLEMVTTKEELDACAAPRNGNGRGDSYGSRKIIVKRDENVSKPTNIHSILSGRTKLLTIEERASICTNSGRILSAVRPKGVVPTHNLESHTFDQLSALINLPSTLEYAHLLECRKADVALRTKTQSLDTYAPIQNKTGTINPKSAVIFNIGTLKKLVEHLENGRGVICLSLAHKDASIVMVWFMTPADIQHLSVLDVSVHWRPTIDPKRKTSSSNISTLNDERYRFDMRMPAERQRLLRRLTKFATDNTSKHSLQFLNEDESQMAKNHYVEQLAYSVVRDALNTLQVVCERRHEDAYTSVDYVIDGTVRVQDKSTTGASPQFCMRRRSGLPYNPDDLDVFQFTVIPSKTIYAFPMRYHGDDEILSFFTSKQLMSRSSPVNKLWFEKNTQYKYDMNDAADVTRYLAFCRSAAAVPPLTNKSFYTEMIADIDTLFAKEYKPRKVST